MTTKQLNRWRARCSLLDFYFKIMYRPGKQWENPDKPTTRFARPAKRLQGPSCSNHQFQTLLEDHNSMMTSRRPSHQSAIPAILLPRSVPMGANSGESSQQPGRRLVQAAEASGGGIVDLSKGMKGQDFRRLIRFFPLRSIDSSNTYNFRCLLLGLFHHCKPGSSSHSLSYKYVFFSLCICNRWP